MQRMSFEEFRDFYNSRGYLPNDVAPRKNSLNSQQLKSRYEKYLRQLEKQEEKTEKKKEEISKDRKEKVALGCLLVQRLREEGHFEHLEFLFNSAGPQIDQVDRAHILSRGAYPELREDEENIIGLNRYSHSLLDEFRDPIYGVEIGREQHRKIWGFIVGEDRLHRLLEKSRSKRKTIIV